MTDKREELMNECNDLGIEFRSNASESALQKLIDDFKDKQAGFTPSPPVATKPEVAVDEQTKGNTETKEAKLRKNIAKRKAEAFKTRIVTITNRDKRESDVVTTAPLSVENQYFGIAKNVPLDIPVELEQCLIKVAENSMIPMHRDEIINGRRTGNKVTVMVKRYSVSYSDKKPD